MKDKINNIYDKIIKLIEEQFTGSSKECKLSIYSNAIEPIKNVKVLFTLFGFGRPSERNIEEFEYLINESKEIAKNYYKPKLVIGDDNIGSKVIKLYYYESQEEVYNRLVLAYEDLKNEVQRINADELAKYNELKAKYENVL